MAQLHGYTAVKAAELEYVGQRQCKPHVCVRCGRTVLRGDSFDYCSIRVDVDIRPVDQLAELLAYLEGRSSYSIRPARGKGMPANAYQLYGREDWSFGNQSYPVLLEHQCAGRDT